MLVSNREYYAAWRDISSDGLRYWLRVWEDGCFSGTHPEWVFNPLTLSGLARLWPYFVKGPGERDWGKSQRHAIRVLASRRFSFPDGERFVCPKAQREQEWNDFWARVLGATEAFRAELFDRLTALLKSTDSPDYASISKTTAVLVGNLLLEGYSPRELWLRTAGVFDTTARRRTMLPVDRALGLLSHLKRRPTKEYLVWTEILQDRTPLSNTLSRRIAPLRLESPAEFKKAVGFASIGGSANVISRLNSTHSLTAFENHRTGAWACIRERSAKIGIPGLGLAEDSQVQQSDLSDRPPWRHAFPSRTAFANLPPPNPSIEPEAFMAGIEAANDDPEETVCILCDAFERALGKDWPELAGIAYIKRLPASLRRQLLSAISEMLDRWEENPAARPKWLETFQPDKPFDFEQVSNSIRQSGSDADLLLAERLELARHENALYYLTPGWVTGWLHLAKGIRNYETHNGSWPIELRCIPAFLARLLVHVFVAAFPQPGRRPAAPR